MKEHRKVPDLIEALSGRRGVVCFVGAGGKKTIMFRIADTHSGRVAVTATAHIERVPRRYKEAFVVADGKQLYDTVFALESKRVVAFAKPSAQVARFAGVIEDELLHIYRNGGFDVCLVKSDGARGRLIKAPAEHEPPLPSYATVVVPVVSARVMGKALSDKVAHRSERVTAVTGLQSGESITPHHLALLLASNEGALKGAREAKVVPVINMVDDSECEILAREAAAEALTMTTRFSQIVLTAMKQEQPVVAIVHR